MRCWCGYLSGARCRLFACGPKTPSSLASFKSRLVLPFWYQLIQVVIKKESVKQGGSSSTHTHRHPFNGPFYGTTRVSRYQKGKTSLDFTEARDSEWQWHRLGYMQVCTSLQADNHASTPPLSFLQAGCPSCRPTNSVKALKGLVVVVVLC